jgi:UDP:flavonoid glycosyltransferase YjiC (YdhE family)
VLCTCLPERGHFHPMVPLARALVEAGHDVAFASAQQFREHIEQAGFASFPAGLTLPEQLESARRRFPHNYALPAGRDRFERFVPRMLGGVAAPARLDGLVEAVKEWKADLVVAGEADFAAPLAAAVADLPWATQSVGPLRPLGMARLTRRFLAPLCRQWDVALDDLAGLFRYLYLDLCPPSLQTAEVAQIDHRYPLRPDPFDAMPGETLPAWASDLGDRPVVYVTLGTVFNETAVLRTVVEGLRAEPVEVVATVGADGDVDALGPQPDNVHSAHYVPQSLLLPACDVMVSHGGSSMLGALRCGVPLLALPQGANQFHNADAGTAAGVARQLRGAAVSCERVRTEVRPLLHEGAYRRRAQEVAQEIAAMPAPAEVVALLEQLAEERAAVP